jgi:ABC-type Mn2+/Zn2+ transport system permease subunit
MGSDRLIVGWVVATLASLVGLWASYQLDLPTGAAIVCACELAVALIGIWSSMRTSRA